MSTTRNTINVKKWIILDDYDKAVSAMIDYISDRVEQEGRIELWTGDFDNMTNAEFDKYLELPHVNEHFENFINCYRIYKLTKSDFGVDIHGYEMDTGLKGTFGFYEMEREQLAYLIKEYL